jgi:hypothetical protein
VMSVAPPISSRSFAANGVPDEGFSNKLASVFKLQNLLGISGPIEYAQMRLQLPCRLNQPGAFYTHRGTVSSVNGWSRSAYFCNSL